MPLMAPPVVDERDALAAYLAQQQDALRTAAHGLTDAEAAARPTPSAFSVGALLKHATDMQEQWLAQVLAAPGAPSAPMAERARSYQAGLVFESEDRLDETVERFDRASAAVLDAVREQDLDLAVPVPEEAPWFPPDVTAWSVRWVWFHLLEELARHAGHADLVREALDGATALPLLAAVEGWPASAWLQPWQKEGVPPR